MMIFSIRKKKYIFLFDKNVCFFIHLKIKGIFASTFHYVYPTTSAFVLSDGIANDNAAFDTKINPYLFFKSISKEIILNKHCSDKKPIKILRTL